MDLKRLVRICMALFVVIGTGLIILNLLNIIHLPDLLQMYSLSAIAVGAVTLITTTEYYRISKEVQARIYSQQQKLFNRVNKDIRKEDRKAKRRRKNIR